MGVSGNAHKSCRFADFQLDLGRELLLRRGEEIPLRPKTFEVLRHLVRHDRTLVSKNELLDAVWRGADVGEGTLSQSISEIRRALEDTDRRIVRTVPRRGFIFDLPVTADDEITPAAGRTMPPAATQTAAPAPYPRRHRRRREIAFLALALAVAAASWLLRPAPPSPAYSIAAANSAIAVLPFVDLGASGDQAYLGAGIADDLINMLSGGSSLPVIARTSSFAYQDRPEAGAREIAEALGAAYVVEGSIRRDGDRVVIRAQLIDAASNTDLWSTRFDRHMADILDVEVEIASAVAGALQASLDLVNAPGFASAGIDPRAHESYLLGKFYYHRRGEGDLRRAREYLEEAVGLDPSHAAAWANLAGVYNIGIFEGRLTMAEGLELMGEAVDRALALAPGNALVHWRAGRYAQLTGDRAGAWAHWGKAMELDPENPMLLGAKAGYLLHLLDVDGAVRLQRKAVALDPQSALYRILLADYLVKAGRYEEAIDQARLLAQLHPTSAPEAMLIEACARVLQERHADALALLDASPRADDPIWIRTRALALRGSGRVAEAEAVAGRLAANGAPGRIFRRAEYDAAVGNAGAALDGLQRLLAFQAQQDESRAATLVNFTEVRSSVFFKPLYDEPRWQAFLDATTENF